MINKINNCEMKQRNTFGISAKCKTLFEYDSIEDLEKIIESIDLKKDKIFNIGSGSNLLFTKDFDGIMLHSKINDIQIEERTNESVLIKVGAGMIWDDFVALTVDNALYGAENLSLIPGTVGASAVQNIGAYGVEAKDIIEKVYCIDLLTNKKIVLTNKDCQFGYRDSIFKHQKNTFLIVTHVSFRLQINGELKLDYGTIRQELGDQTPSLSLVRKTIIKIRETKLPDPKKLGSAGSFFKNPIISTAHYECLKKQYENIPSYEVENGRKIPAAWLIEQCGWKGKRVSDAGVHPIQPLVLVNYGNANGKEIVELAQSIQQDVQTKFNITIEPEAIFI